MFDITKILTSTLEKGGVDKIVELTGVDKATAGKVVSAGLPILMKQLGNNAVSKTKSQALDKVLDTKKTMGVSKINPADGEKILSHVFGKKMQTAISEVGNTSGVDAESSKKVLSSIAPLALSALGKLKAKEGLDIKSIGKMAKQVASGDNIVLSLLDQDGDGDYKDDLLSMAIKYVRSFFSKK